MKRPEHGRRYESYPTGWEYHGRDVLSLSGLSSRPSRFIFLCLYDSTFHRTPIPRPTRPLLWYVDPDHDPTLHSQPDYVPHSVSGAIGTRGVRPGGRGVSETSKGGRGDVRRSTRTPVDPHYVPHPSNLYPRSVTASRSWVSDCPT